MNSIFTRTDFAKLQNPQVVKIVFNKLTAADSATDAGGYIALSAPSMYGADSFKAYYYYNRSVGGYDPREGRPEVSTFTYRADSTNSLVDRYARIWGARHYQGDTSPQGDSFPFHIYYRTASYGVAYGDTGFDPKIGRKEFTYIKMIGSDSIAKIGKYKKFYIHRGDTLLGARADTTACYFLFAGDTTTTSFTGDSLKYIITRVGDSTLTASAVAPLFANSVNSWQSGTYFTASVPANGPNATAQISKVMMRGDSYPIILADSRGWGAGDSTLWIARGYPVENRVTQHSTLDGTYFVLQDGKQRKYAPYYKVAGITSFFVPPRYGVTPVAIAIASGDSHFTVGTKTAAILNKINADIGDTSFSVTGDSTLIITNKVKNRADTTIDAVTNNRRTWFTFSTTQYGSRPDVLLVANKYPGNKTNDVTPAGTITTVSASITAGVNGDSALYKSKSVGIPVTIVLADTRFYVGNKTNNTVNTFFKTYGDTLFTMTGDSSAIITNKYGGNVTNTSSGTTLMAAATIATVGVNPVPRFYKNWTTRKVDITVADTKFVVASKFFTAMAADSAYFFQSRSATGDTTTITNRYTGKETGDTVSLVNRWKITTPTTGDSAYKSMLVSTAPKNFYFFPTKNMFTYIRHIDFTVGDTNWRAFYPTNFLTRGAMANGVVVTVMTGPFGGPGDTVKKQIVTTLKTTADLITSGDAWTVSGNLGTVSAPLISAHFDMTSSFGEEIELNGPLGEYLRVNVGDTTSILKIMQMQIEGHDKSPSYVLNNRNY